MFRATTKTSDLGVKSPPRRPYRRPLLEEIPKKATWHMCAHRHFNGDRVALEPRCDVLGLGLRHQPRGGGRKRVFLGLELTGGQTDRHLWRQRSVLNLEFPKASTEAMMTGAIRLPVELAPPRNSFDGTRCMWCGMLIRCADRGGIIISRCRIHTHTRVHTRTHSHTHTHFYAHTTHGSSPGAC